MLVCFKGTHVARTLLLYRNVTVFPLVAALCGVVRGSVLARVNRKDSTYRSATYDQSFLTRTNRNASGCKRCSQACNKFNSLLCVAMRANGINAHVNRHTVHALQVSRLDGAYAALGCVLRVGNHSVFVAAGH